MGVKPTNERQTRALADLDPEDQRSVWQQVVQESNGVPTAAKIGEVKKTFMEVIRERIVLRNGKEPETVGSELSRKELAELRAEQKRNTDHNVQLWQFIDAIKLLALPTITIAQVAEEIRWLDSPETNWCSLAAVASVHLAKLAEELGKKK